LIINKKKFLEADASVGKHYKRQSFHQLFCPNSNKLDTLGLAFLYL